jgi:hypothetical protein
MRNHNFDNKDRKYIKNKRMRKKIINFVEILNKIL